MSTATKLVVVGCLVTVCVTGWFLCGALRDAQRLLEVASGWETEGHYDTFLGKIRHILSLTRLIQTPRDPMYICGVPSSMTWPKLLPLVFNLQKRLKCLEKQVDKAKEEHLAFIQCFFFQLVIAAGVVVASVWLAKKILRSKQEAKNMNSSQHVDDDTQLTPLTERERYTEQNMFYSNVESIAFIVFFQSQLNKIIVLAASNTQTIEKIVSLSPSHPKINNRMINLASSHIEIINVITAPSSSAQPRKVITAAASHPQQEPISIASAHEDKQIMQHEATTIRHVPYHVSKMTPNHPFQNMKANLPHITHNVCFNEMERQVFEILVSEVLLEVVKDSYLPLKIVLELMEELVDKCLMVAASKVVVDEAMNAKTIDVAEQATGNSDSTGDVGRVQLEEEEAEKTVRRSLYLPPRYANTILGTNEDFLQHLRHTYTVTTGRNFVTNKLHIIGRKNNVLAAYASVKARLKQCKDQCQDSTSKSTKKKKKKKQCKDQCQDSTSKSTKKKKKKKKKQCKDQCQDSTSKSTQN